jgi:molybdenum cofactor biosynthesis enzyme MoaA
VANLSITSRCNADCAFCFARSAQQGVSESDGYMSRELFESCLEFLDRSGIGQARLIGGEPTLHPRFPELSQRALDRGFRLLVFSNGLIREAALEWLERAPADRVSVLLNAAVAGGARRDVVLARLGPRVTLSMALRSPGVYSN